ncbi:MAG: glycosyltransferase family 2 protein [bacterium]|nr:glycosyltransferase family 2 protein [bacterium]
MDRFPYSISVVIGVYNDEDVLHLLEERLVASLEALTADWEVILVDDGSADRSHEILMEMARRESRFQVITFARNFGQANSLSAGLQLARKDLVVLMDSDLQDRPEDIRTLIEAMIGNNVHMAVSQWKTRKDSKVKTAMSRLFQWTTNRVSSVKIVPGMGVFRVIRQEAVHELRRIPEHTGTSLGLLHWMGFDHVLVELDRDPRAAGASGYTFRKMVTLAMDRIFSYSDLPINFSITMGMVLSILSILSGIYYALQRIIGVTTLPGWTSLITILLFLFGLNFLILGLFGQYISRIYNETRGRPKYIVDYMRSRFEPPKITEPKPMRDEQ